MQNDIMNGHESILSEIKQIGREIAELQHQIHLAVGSLAELARRFDALEPIGAPVKCGAETHSHDVCKSCGTKLEHHGAEAGDLLICRNCGWSEFVDTEGAESCVHSEYTLFPAGETRNAWARS